MVKVRFLTDGAQGSGGGVMTLETGRAIRKTSEVGKLQLSLQDREQSNSGEERSRKKGEMQMPCGR